jgi:hypothetical protein
MQGRDRAGEGRMGRMSDPRYAPGIAAGIANSIHLGTWPEEIPGLGTKSGGKPFARCVKCPKDAHPFKSGTYVSYGGQPLCKAHANEAAQKATA